MKKIDVLDLFAGTVSAPRPGKQKAPAPLKDPQPDQAPKAPKGGAK